MSEEKIYCGNGKEKVFDDGGSLLKFSFSPDDMTKLNNSAGLKNGWVNIVISKRKQVSDKGVTHYATIDNWQPKEGTQRVTLAQANDMPDDRTPF